MKWRTDDRGWNPYLAGAMTGVLAIASALATTKMLGKTNYLGASTTFVRAAGLLQKPVAQEHVAANEYYTKEKIKVDWQFMLVVGIFLGALLSSLKLEKVVSAPRKPVTRARRHTGSICGRAWNTATQMPTR